MESGLAPLGERRRLLQAWALVDLLGWPVERSGPVELEVHGHREGLLGALQGNADRLARLIADEPDDPQRASRRDDLQALLEFEGAALHAVERDRRRRSRPRCRRCGRVAAWRAVRDLNARARTCRQRRRRLRASWAGVLRRIGQARRALDVIGWASPSEQQPLILAVDATMIEALETDAEQWEWASEQETIESAEGRALAATHAATIERFLGNLAKRPAPTTLLIPVSAFGLCGRASWTA